jgi:NADH:ubiquinone oxidoreductase subunit 4 (subunit M)
VIAGAAALGVIFAAVYLLHSSRSSSWVRSRIPKNLSPQKTSVPREIAMIAPLLLVIFWIRSLS